MILYTSTCFIGIKLRFMEEYIPKKFEWIIFQKNNLFFIQIYEINLAK